MMKNIIIYFLALCPIIVFGQSAEREVIASLGSKSISVTGMQVSQTIGETVVNSTTSSSVIVSAGFQQGTGMSTAVDDFDENTLFSVYPNPFGDVLNVKVETTKAVNLELSFVDIRGAETPIPVSQFQVVGNAERSIDCSELAVGSYMLQIRDVKTGALKVVPIQKIH